jgi:hypothetical protein
MIRKKIYHTFEELEIDLDLRIKRYNEFRTHPGRHCYGKTLMQTFLDAKYILQEKTRDMLMRRSDSDSFYKHTNTVITS